MNNYCQRINYQILPVYVGLVTYMVADFNGMIYFQGTYIECWNEMKRLEQKYWDEYYGSIKVICSDSTDLDIQIAEHTFT